MYENRVLHQKYMKNLDEIKEVSPFNKTIDNVIKLSNNLKKGERMIIEPKGIGCLATVIKIGEVYKSDYPYDISEGEIKLEYQFNLVF